MKVAVFGYAWNRKFQPDAYMTETIAAFTALGLDVDLILGNQITKEYGIYGLNALPLGDIAAWIGAQRYDLALSFNNSMLLPEVLAALDAPVLTMIVDEPEHLFAYRPGGLYDVFAHDIQIIALSSELEERITAAVARVGPRLHFLPPATQVEAPVTPASASYPISWVASLVGDLNLHQYLDFVAEQPAYRELTQLSLTLAARDGDLRELRAAQGSPALDLVATLPWPFDYFEMQIQNILTNRRRLEVVERLGPHGLALFGNAEWRRLLSSSAAVFEALRPGEPVSGHAQLRGIYDASQLAINVPQAHVSPRAIQYRVLDIMASKALLITQAHPRSDLYRIFGQDCPVPTYRDLDELERLCLHFLSREEERLALVAACNARVRTGFSFGDRARDLLRIAGLAAPASAHRGYARALDLRTFANASDDQAAS